MIGYTFDTFRAFTRRVKAKMEIKKPKIKPNKISLIRARDSDIQLEPNQPVNVMPQSRLKLSKLDH